MWQFITTLIMEIIHKENYMAFIAGLICGTVIGGLVGVFVTPLFWKPKQ